MIEVKICDSVLRRAAEAGLDEFFDTFVTAILQAAGGRLDSENMALLNSDQITLVAYSMLREEVMDGGFVQLIHNGLGPFFFRNPFDKAVTAWGIADLAALMRKGRKLYHKHRSEIEIECDEDTFMALFEKLPAFDDLDDTFVANEETWTQQIACYIDNNIERFCTVVNDEA